MTISRCRPRIGLFQISVFFPNTPEQLFRKWTKVGGGKGIAESGWHDARWWLEDKWQVLTHAAAHASRLPTPSPFRGSLSFNSANSRSKLHVRVISHAWDNYAISFVLLSPSAEGRTVTNFLGLCPRCHRPSHRSLFVADSIMPMPCVER